MIQQPAQTVSLPTLLRELGTQAKTFIAQELRLAKTEMGEKFSEWSGDAAWIGIGAVAAYAGFIVLLVALAMVAGMGFERLDIDSSLALSAGFGAIGLLAAIVGAIMLLRAVKTFSSETLAPDKTITAFQKLRGEPVSIKIKGEDREHEEPVRSEDLEKKVIAAEDRLGRTFEEFERRITFSRARRRLTENVRLHPYRIGTIALAAGLLFGWRFVRKLRI